MDYPTLISERLKPKTNGNPIVLDLFAGCGGLALGFEAQGFETIGYEMDSICCETYNKNLTGKCLTETLTPDSDLPKASVVIGGPPCQPFSVIGKQNGLSDSRDGFPTFISAIKRLDPDIWLFENVRGLLYRSKSYFESILKELKRCNYVIEFQLLNAVNYEVPQNRERLIVVGHRGEFFFPKPAKRKITAGEALGVLVETAPPESRFLTKSMDEYIARYERASQCINPRNLNLNSPARTLTCRNLAGATSDMQRVLLPDGRRRRLLLQEAARLQSFPDWFEFQGTENQIFYQIGNAVPPMLSYHLAAAVRAYLESNSRLSSGEITYRNLPPQLELPFASEKEELSVPEFVKPEKKKKTTRLVINEALYILSVLGIPFEGLSERRLEKMAMAFLV
jgi:DNA (cytosine-5)-methyltransferase 1